MYLRKNFPYIVGGYVIAVGIFFCLSTLIEGVLLDPKTPGRHYLLVLSAIFVGIGTLSIYLFNRGKLKRSGKSIIEVRQEAVEKMKDPTMLAQIALEEKNLEVRKTAEERLKELNC
jgi:hypothetical protein